MQEQEPQLQSSAHTWLRVSPKYAVADLIANLIVDVIVLVVLAVVFTNVGWKWWNIAIIIAVAIVLLGAAALAFRRVKAIGYILRDDDLVFRRGIMFERIIAVPYGRLQLVDVTRGPLLRALGLATLKFITAAPSTGVQLPGLRVEDAEELRDRLVSLAETRRSGL